MSSEERNLLSVVLGRTSPVYNAGELLTGDVVINATTECKILELTVNFCGLSVVSFLMSEDECKSQTCGKVEETDVHLDVLHPIIRSYRGIPIDAGVHTHPFSLRLPELLPSSYKSPYGQIGYYIQVHLHTSACTLDVRKPFVVRAPVNINFFLACQSPQCAEVIKKYGMIGNKTLRLKASISKTWFVPGDVISVFVEVNNDTNRQLRYLFCTLKQVTNVQVQLEDKTISRLTKQCLMTMAYKVTDGMGHYSWLCQLSSSPLLMPTIAASTIVFVTYVVKVSAKLKRVSIPPEVEIPIVFGIRAPVSRRRRNVQLQINDTSMTNSDCNMTRAGGSYQPTATNPRRRITVSSQPQLNFTPRISQMRRVSMQLQSIASNLTQRLTNQFQSGIYNSLRRFKLRSST